MPPSVNTLCCWCKLFVSLALWDSTHARIPPTECTHAHTHTNTHKCLSVFTTSSYRRTHKQRMMVCMNAHTSARVDYRVKCLTKHLKQWHASVRVAQRIGRRFQTAPDNLLAQKLSDKQVKPGLNSIERWSAGGITLICDYLWLSVSYSGEKSTRGDLTAIQSTKGCTNGK